MLRISEALLFFLPFILFAGWMLLGERAQRLLWAGLALLIVLGVAVGWLGISNRLPANAAYVPAQTVGGRIVDGHAAGR